MIPVKTPELVKQSLKSLVWEKPNADNKIYLTFDDGPIPEVTPWILEVLNKYDIKATFFCVGENIIKYPDIFKTIVSNGHSVGNHTYNHLNGWHTKTKDYLDNIEKTNHIFKKLSFTYQLFRPPYGKLKPVQLSKLNLLDYKIIMWSILSKDYNENIGYKKVFENLTKHTKSGDILVCHDNIKAFENIKKALPKAIEFLLKKDFVFGVL